MIIFKENQNKQQGEGVGRKKGKKREKNTRNDSSIKILSLKCHLVECLCEKSFDPPLKNFWFHL